MQLLSEVSFASIAVYSPRGTSHDADVSRQLIRRFKGGEAWIGGRIAERLVRPKAEIFRDFLGPDRILVPVPRSSLHRPGDYWPAEIMCAALFLHDLGQDQILLQRTEPVKKSAGSSDRTPARRHLETLECAAELLPAGGITLVDDVVTLGNTFLGAASAVQAVYPDREIRCFAISRTLGLRPDIEGVVEPFVGTIVRSGEQGRRTDS